jgi:glycosyltransferase involved in cell wall biosynthesis
MIARPAAGGIARHVATLTAGLVDRGIEIVLFAPSDFDDSGVPAAVRRQPLPIRSRTNPLADWMAVRRLRQELAAGFDLVHAHGLRAALIGVHASAGAGVPAIFTAHNMPPVRRLVDRLAVRSIARRTAAIVAISRAVAAGIEANNPGGAPVVVVPNGIDLARFSDLPDRASARQELDLPADAPVIAAIGRLSPEKGFHVLIRSLPEVVKQSPEAHLVIAGDGPLRAALSAAIESSLPEPERRRVRLIGRLADVRPLLAAADLFAAPSLSEGQGIAAIEAMAAGLAVVASDVGGLPEVVENGVTGRLVTSDVDHILAEALCELIRNAEMRARFGAAGRERAFERFSAERMVERTLEVYRQCAGRA